MLLSVIVPARGRVELLREVLRRLDNQEDSGFEILVIADGCRTVIEYATTDAFRHPLRVFDTGGGNAFGATFARNLGAQKARGDMMIFLDADCLVTSSHVATYRNRFAEKTLLIGSITHVAEDNWDTVLFPEGRPAFTRPTAEPWPAAYGVFCYTGNMAVPREAFRRIGGFDMDFINKGSGDSDFGLRFAHSFGRFEFIDNRVRHVGVSSGYRADRDPLDRSLYRQRKADNLYRAGSPILTANGGPTFFATDRWSWFEDLRGGGAHAGREGPYDGATRPRSNVTGSVLKAPDGGAKEFSREPLSLLPNGIVAEG